MGTVGDKKRRQDGSQHEGVSMDIYRHFSEGCVSCSRWHFQHNVRLCSVHGRPGQDIQKHCLLQDALGNFLYYNFYTTSEMWQLNNQPQSQSHRCRTAEQEQQTRSWNKKGTFFPKSKTSRFWPEICLIWFKPPWFVMPSLNCKTLYDCMEWNLK